MSPPSARSGPQVAQPGSRPESQALAKAPNVTDMVAHDGDAATQVAVELGVLRVAAGLIASQAERERQAYEHGVLFGFSRGWTLGLEAGAERGCAA